MFFPRFPEIPITRLRVGGAGLFINSRCIVPSERVDSVSSEASIGV